MEKKFNGGQLVATAAVKYIAEKVDPFLTFMKGCITRHYHGDWGDVDDDDRKVNEDSLKLGERVFSVYKIPSELLKDIPEEYSLDTKIWIITERDRSVTTVLLPSEY